MEGVADVAQNWRQSHKGAVRTCGACRLRGLPPSALLFAVMRLGLGPTRGRLAAGPRVATRPRRIEYLRPIHRGWLLNCMGGNEKSNGNTDSY